MSIGRNNRGEAERDGRRNSRRLTQQIAYEKPRASCATDARARTEDYYSKDPADPARLGISDTIPEMIVDLAWFLSANGPKESGVYYFVKIEIYLIGNFVELFVSCACRSQKDNHSTSHAFFAVHLPSSLPVSEFTWAETPWFVCLN
jgi:hypothetical protein